MSGENVGTCSRKRVKCARPGKKTRNAFFMFLRNYRTKNCGKSMPQLAKEAGRLWNGMSSQEKQKYKEAVSIKAQFWV